jgi:hypothetical protein
MVKRPDYTADLAPGPDDFLAAGVYRGTYLNATLRGLHESMRISINPVPLANRLQAREFATRRKLRRLFAPACHFADSRSQRNKLREDWRSRSERSLHQAHDEIVRGRCEAGRHRVNRIAELRNGGRHLRQRVRRSCSVIKAHDRAGQVIRRQLQDGDPVPEVLHHVSDDAENRLISGRHAAQPAGNGGQGATASLASTAILAMWNL